MVVLGAMARAKARCCERRFGTRAVGDPSTWRLHVDEHPDALRAVASEWDRLAEPAGSPFLATGWLCAWWSSLGRRGLLLTLRDANGNLRAGGCWHRPARKRLDSATDVHSEDWDVVATDDAARAELWRRAAAHAEADRVEAARLPASGPSSELAGAALAAAGFQIVLTRGSPSPYLELPRTSEELLASVSRRLRARLRQYRRALERTGRLASRNATAESLERDLETFLRLEAAGWKGKAGTAILSDGRTARLYRGAARAFADVGWLRLQLLEVDGNAVAGDLSCFFAGSFHLVKTAFDERHAASSPGLLMREESLRGAVEEGARRYEFLGAPDPYKMRWGAALRERSTLSAYRGPWGSVHVMYRRNLRPVLKSARDRALPWLPGVTEARPTK